MLLVFGYSLIGLVPVAYAKFVVLDSRSAVAKFAAARVVHSPNVETAIPFDRRPTSGAEAV